MILIYLLGCIASYFFTRAVLGSKPTIGNIFASIIISVLSWAGLVFLAVTWLFYQLFMSDKEF